ncbi:MAG: hypothetical protein KGQ48_15225 [Bradyrhizobium sp.]|nr:hypothetical protein [Bradyrhizobium sp.]
MEFNTCDGIDASKDIQRSAKRSEYQSVTPTGQTPDEGAPGIAAVARRRFKSGIDPTRLAPKGGLASSPGVGHVARKQGPFKGRKAAPDRQPQRRLYRLASQNTPETLFRSKRPTPPVWPDLAENILM